MKGEIKESIRTASKTLSLRADSGDLQGHKRQSLRTPMEQKPHSDKGKRAHVRGIV
jgi:hypothetical protein